MSPFTDPKQPDALIIDFVDFGTHEQEVRMISDPLVIGHMERLRKAAEKKQCQPDDAEPSEELRVVEEIQAALRARLEANEARAHALSLRGDAMSAKMETLRQTIEEVGQMAAPLIPLYHKGQRRKEARDEALVKLREEHLPDGKQRTWKEVCTALVKLNDKWKMTDDAARLRYAWIKSHPSR
jgi:hypothetical protein